MVQKSLFAKFKGLFLKQKGNRNGSTLSASQAINVQNNYIQGYCDVASTLLPPYSEIVKQLYSPQPEIFSAALYYLQKIAANEPGEKDGIISSMQNILTEKNKVSPEHKNKIKRAILAISSNSPFIATDL